MVERDCGPFGEGLTGSGAVGSSGKAPEIGAWPLTSEPGAKEKEKPAEKKEEKSKEKRKDDGKKTKEVPRKKARKRRERSRSPAGKRSPEQAKKKRRSSSEEPPRELEGEDLRRAKATPRRREERSPSERGPPREEEVRENPAHFGLGQIQVRGSVAEHLLREKREDPDSRKPAEPRGPPPRRAAEEEYREDRGRVPRGNRRGGERSGRHYERGVQYWKKVRAAKRK